MKIEPTIVRLTHEVAALLAKLRRPGESWSDVIGRCARTEAEASASELPFGVSGGPPAAARNDHEVVIGGGK